MGVIGRVSKNRKLELSEGIVAGHPQVVASKPRGKTVNPGTPPTLIVDANAPGKILRYRNSEWTAGSLLVAIGGALAVVGMTDLALLWFPMQLGVAGWEFATVSRTFTNAPMTMVGLVLVAYGLVRKGAPPAMIRTIAVGFAVLSFVLVAIGMLYAMAAPAVLFQSSGEAATTLKRAIIKNGVEIVVYPVVLLGIAAILWNAVSKEVNKEI